MRTNANLPLYGFKVSLYQLFQTRAITCPKHFINKLYESGWHIIYISRSDTVYQAFSLIKAKATNIYHLKKGESLIHTPIEVSIPELFKTIYALKYYRKREVRILSSMKYTSINYETDLKESYVQQFTIDRICDEFNLDHAAVHTDHIKTSASNINDDFKNGSLLLVIAKLFACFITPIMLLSEMRQYYQNCGANLWHKKSRSKPALEI
jgi:hypothetical protein